MQISERSASRTSPVALPPPQPRITPVHDPVERRHGDLSFHVETGGRPCFRVLVARERSLFAPENAGARNGSNFYDSMREGLLPFDGTPCFYLLPRSVLHGLLPAPRLFYTLIAYDDRSGTRAAHAHPPETLAASAPSVRVAPDLTTGSLAFMFGTAVQDLLLVEASSPSMPSIEEEGEDVGEALALDAPENIGLEPDDGIDDAGEAEAQAAAYDAVDPSLDPGQDDDELEPEPAVASELGEQEYDDGYGEGTDDVEARAAAFEEEEEWEREPVTEGLETSRLDEGDGDLDEADDDVEPREPAAATATSLRADDGDGYDDGYDLPVSESARHDGPGDEYLAEHELDGGLALQEETKETEPEMLPDEDDDRGAALAGERDEADAVEIEPSAHATALENGSSAPGRPFDIEACKSILARVMPFESGQDGFARVEPDGEFAGRYGTNHPAYRRYHLGLTFGAFPFVQEHGTLGQLLGLMRQRDAATFDRTFGPEAASLIATTTSEGPPAWESRDGLSVRLSPVAGARLWEEPWLGKFRRAGGHPAFQGAQNELAARLYVQPILKIAGQLGLDSEQALTLFVDRSVQMGPGAAIAWVLEAVSPLQTIAQSQQALARLGHQDVRTFQAAQDLPTTGTWDAATRAALIAAMRRRSDSPVPIPTREQMVDALVRRAEGTPWAERARRLRAATSAVQQFQL